MVIRKHFSTYYTWNIYISSWFFIQNFQVEDEEGENKESNNSNKTITNEQLVTDLCDCLLGILEHELKPWVLLLCIVKVMLGICLFFDYGK